MWGHQQGKKTNPKELLWTLHGVSEGRQMKELGSSWQEPVRRNGLEGPHWSPSLLEGLAVLVGEHHKKCLIAEECFIESRQMLSVPSCLCPCRALNITSPALKQNLCCNRFQLPLRSSHPAFEAGSRKCLSRVTSKFGAWCRHTKAECLGPGLREEHVVLPSRCLR